MIGEEELDRIIIRPDCEIDPETGRIGFSSSFSPCSGSFPSKCYDCLRAILRGQYSRKDNTVWMSPKLCKKIKGSSSYPIYFLEWAIREWTEEEYQKMLPEILKTYE